MLRMREPLNDILAFFRNLEEGITLNFKGTTRVSRQKFNSRVMIGGHS